MFATVPIFGQNFMLHIPPGKRLAEEETVEWYRSRIKSMGMEGADEEVARARSWPWGEQVKAEQKAT